MKYLSAFAGLALAVLYAVITYRRFAGKVTSGDGGY